MKLLVPSLDNVAAVQPSAQSAQQRAPLLAPRTPSQGLFNACNIKQPCSKWPNSTHSDQETGWEPSITIVQVDSSTHLCTRLLRLEIVGVLRRRSFGTSSMVVFFTSTSGRGRCLNDCDRNGCRMFGDSSPLKRVLLNQLWWGPWETGWVSCTIYNSTEKTQCIRMNRWASERVGLKRAWNWSGGTSKLNSGKENSGSFNHFERQMFRHRNN